jgi:hypothetical protein
MLRQLTAMNPQSAIEFPFPVVLPERKERYLRVCASPNIPHWQQFETAIPAGWVSESPRLLRHQSFLVYSTMRPKNRLDAELRVGAAKPGRDVNPADWLEITWGSVGSQIIHRRDFRAHGGTHADMLVKYSDEKGTWISRSTIVKDGPRLYYIEARAAPSTYSTLAEDFLMCLASFRLLYPNSSATAELLSETMCRTPVLVRFQRPEFWLCSPPSENPETNSIQLESRFDNADVGKITVDLHEPGNGTSMYRMANGHADRLKQRGIHLDGAALIPLQASPPYHGAVLYSPVATENGHEFEVPLLFLQHPTALVVLGLYTPSRNESPEWWAINKRAFEIVRDSLTIG